MKIRNLYAIGLGWLLALPAMSQITFYATNLPSIVGETNRYYYSTNHAYLDTLLKLATNYAGPLPPGAGTGIPQVWDFSPTQQASESVLRTDIVPATNGPDASYFTTATYAERDTLEPSSPLAWRYYSITNTGRTYYGFYVPLSINAPELAQFDAPTIDIPPIVHFKDTWSRTVTWAGGSVFDYQFTTTATVDAYGTITLPSLGSFPTLRVHEVQDNQLDLIGYPLEDAPDDLYYWLVPGLGVAMQILQNQPDSYGNLGATNNFVQRLFYASYYTPPPTSTPPPAGNLRIHLGGGSVQLYWFAFTNVTSYQVQAKSSLNQTNWQTLASTTATNWSETLTTNQRIYRVVGTP